jgi:hypothetical protein
MAEDTGQRYQFMRRIGVTGRLTIREIWIAHAP